MILRGWKEIEAYVGARIGGVSVAALKRWSARHDDPMPVADVLGRRLANTTKLDQWLSRQIGKRRRARLAS